jgi:hypothetical protein
MSLGVTSFGVAFNARAEPSIANAETSLTIIFPNDFGLRSSEMAFTFILLLNYKTPTGGILQPVHAMPPMRSPSFFGNGQQAKPCPLRFFVEMCGFVQG